MLLYHSFSVSGNDADELALRGYHCTLFLIPLISLFPFIVWCKVCSAVWLQPAVLDDWNDLWLAQIWTSMFFFSKSPPPQKRKRCSYQLFIHIIMLRSRFWGGTNETQKQVQLPLSWFVGTDHKTEWHCRYIWQVKQKRNSQSRLRQTNLLMFNHDND